MGVDELERLLGQLEPEELEARYGSQLDPEAQAAFAAFKRTCAQLNQLADHVAATVPPMPVPRRSKPLLRLLGQPLSLPAWSVPLAAAAMVCLGLLLPRATPAPALPQPHQTVVPELATVRADQVPDTAIETARIADAFVARAKVLQERREFALAWNDYLSALALAPADGTPQRDRLLEELQIIAESLKDQDKLQQVTALRSAAP